MEDKEPALDWATLREQLLAEGKVELVKAIDLLIHDSQTIEAAKLMRELHDYTQTRH